MACVKPASEPTTNTPGAGARWTAIRTLAIDAQSAQIISALASRDIDALLLKGPTLARLLYHDGEQRGYLDTDVLVSPVTLVAAEDVLRDLGYERVVGARSMGLIGSHGYAWRREGSRAAVDLHHTIPGVAGPPAELWEALRPYTVSMSLHGTEIPALSAPALAFHVALHAAHHGIGGAKPLQDLDRALSRVGLDDWAAARTLAGCVDALDAFGTGLRMLPRGVALASQLRLPASRSRRVTMAAMNAPSVAIAADRLQVTPGLGAKAMLLLGKAFPPADFVRLGWPLARRGRVGLALAYPWRLIMLATQAASAVVAWRAAARAMAARPSDAPRS